LGTAADKHNNIKIAFADSCKYEHQRKVEMKEEQSVFHAFIPSLRSLFVLVALFFFSFFTVRFTIYRVHPHGDQ